MARKKRRARRGATTYATDEELTAFLAEHAPETLQTKVAASAFDAAVEAVLKETPTANIRHFYCRPCGEYHLKTHLHYRAMKERRAVLQPTKSKKRQKKA